MSEHLCVRCGEHPPVSYDEFCIDCVEAIEREREEEDPDSDHSQRERFADERMIDGAWNGLRGR